MATAHRVSYVIPTPAHTPPRLALPGLDAPRNGRSKPLVRPADRDPDGSARHRTFLRAPPHPQHRLGVSALALDTTTQLAGRHCPEGILYSGGRDGLLIAWELGIPTKPRARKYGLDERKGRALRNAWEVVTGWEDEEEYSDDAIDASADLDRLQLGLAPLSAYSRPQPEQVPIPYESQWEADVSQLDGVTPQSSFRQSVQSHTDWVNDIILCNYNQTVVSASSDGTVKAWNPHEATPSRSTYVLGRHMDYVRCLAHSHSQNWIASGSFDRTIKLWDLSASSTTNSLNPVPITSLSLPESNAGPKASIYALATDLAGSVIAAGSPEKVIRTWDPRARRRTGKLVGHTDNIRSILMSEDGKYLLSGSSDATIKLWSLTAQRCLHTFTYHTDSVWSLFSSHPNLEIFYSGDRSGLVCKVDIERCSDIPEGECVVVCRDSDEGINGIVGMDDAFIWTATGSSSIKRWKAPSRRALRLKDPIQFVEADVHSRDSPIPTPRRTTFTSSPPTSPTPYATFLRENRPLESPAPYNPDSPLPTHVSHPLSIRSLTPSDLNGAPSEPTLFGLPFSCHVRLAPPPSPYSPQAFSPRRIADADVATLYSAASVLSVPLGARSSASPFQTNRQAGFHPISERIPSLESAFRQGSMQDYVSSVPASATFAPQSRVPLPAEPADLAPDFERARYEERELAVDATALSAEPDDVISGTYGLVRSIILNDRIHALTVDMAGEVAIWDLIRGTCLGYYAKEDVESASQAGSARGTMGSTHERSPREALETVRERIEGDAVMGAWSTVDTRVGDLTVHLQEGRCFEAEVYSDELGYAGIKGFEDEHRLNIGKWVLSNLFAGFVQAVLDVHAPPDTTQPDQGSSPKDLQPSARRRRPDLSLTAKLNAGEVPNVMPAPTPAIIPVTPLVAKVAPTPISPLTSIGTSDIKSSSVSQGDGQNPSALSTSFPGSPPGVDTQNAATPHPKATPGAGLKENAVTDYFSIRTAKGIDAEDAAASLAFPSTPGGKLMGKIRNIGKTPKRPASGEEGAATPAPDSLEQSAVKVAKDSDRVLGEQRPSTALQSILSRPLNPPTLFDAPLLDLAPNTAVILSERTSDASGWTSIYQGLTSTMGNDLEALGSALPSWLLEYLLLDKAALPSPVKMTFQVLPWDGGGDPPPELLTNQARLTANRVLRVRKILVYIKEKYETVTSSNGKAPLSGSPPPPTTEDQSIPPVSISQALESTTSATRDQKPEELFELLCNDVVLPLNMTLAAVRQYMWRQYGELVLHYRLKAPQPG
ncbi:hypothetical protein BOTBODRAFT_30189 [Botryobasidium botryosum FD-172 SS1]|uniref:Uncharacterized protein n=1 Tax=Botryobasidium botryosum (strain FD-172 SS1) TaxID=930990 RepID=A0A067N0V1_BOTB1|nr:hypothetical protein BOTBODRAFT_30189 [Botryobasidium botryosum FD-172 SS1]